MWCGLDVLMEFVYVLCVVVGGLLGGRWVTTWGKEEGRELGMVQKCGRGVGRCVNGSGD